jgi:WD40 repeat protein
MGRVRDPATGRELKQLGWQPASLSRHSGSHAEAVTAVAISPDGKTAASAAGRYWTTGDKVPPQLKVWDVETGKSIATRDTGGTEFRSPGGVVRALAFTPDGQLLIAAGDDGVVRLLNLKTLRPVKELPGQGEPVLAVAVAPGGKRFATAGRDQAVRLWETATGRELAVFRGHDGPVHNLAFGPDGRRLASASADGTVRIWTCPD